jgi:hypothetical protein
LLAKGWGEGNDAISVIRIFLTTSFDLQERRPLDELSNGNVEEIVLDAQRYGEMESL